MSGQIAGLVNSIESTQKIIERMIADMKPLLEKVKAIVKG